MTIPPYYNHSGMGDMVGMNSMVGMVGMNSMVGMVGRDGMDINE